MSAATSNGTHEMLIVSDCGEKYTDVSLLGTKMEHLNEVNNVLNFKSVVPAFGNRVVREKPGNFSCVTGAILKR